MFEARYGRCTCASCELSPNILASASYSQNTATLELEESLAGSSANAFFVNRNARPLKAQNPTSDGLRTCRFSNRELDKT